MFMLTHGALIISGIGISTLFTIAFPVIIAHLFTCAVPFLLFTYIKELFIKKAFMAQLFNIVCVLYLFAIQASLSYRIHVFHTYNVPIVANHSQFVLYVIATVTSIASFILLLLSLNELISEKKAKVRIKQHKPHLRLERLLEERYRQRMGYKHINSVR